MTRGSAGPPPDLERLLSPFGVISDCQQTQGESWHGDLTAFHSTLGSGVPGRGAPAGRSAGGAGHTFRSPDTARLIALAEAAERYSTYEPPDTAYTWATVGELDGPVLDTDRIPRCSGRELAHPRCPLREFDPQARIRWVRGLDLIAGDGVWLPWVMSNYGPHAVAEEQFWYRISTGFAVHTDPVEAVVRGICEIIERDMIALTWLQRLELSSISDTVTTPLIEYVRDAARRHFVEIRLLDATSDLGVPTVYCLLTAPHDPKVNSTVGCSTGRNLASAAEKALSEALWMRSLLHRQTSPPPGAPGDCVELTDGALFMGSAEFATEFDFLRRGGPAASRAVDLPEEPAAALRDLLLRLDERDMQVVAAEHTTTELAEVGLTSVSVVIPELMPMSLLSLAQYRAHPRLYAAPVAMGFPARSEEELNPWPQPFA
ncbi:YcaO-like family protein [Streptomyces tubercidicus]|uniref:YcaO-like family protein n=1 Tax=Streptomyces tubercidicus TaxID=47759 RepID=UPI0030E0EA6B|nr:YcaO-like family protein [Streptomyces tubercidicus]